MIFLNVRREPFNALAHGLASGGGHPLPLRPDCGWISILEADVGEKK
jgi:hypothetical protein